ncbi:SNAP25 homologous protein SNAP33-like isoform X2 [Rhodamnia argentea]|uniref:SNAP25 homologous protein SNAP33-like isoform X2 n=1 Tax=Rhodamnia argentea TaxID=178133 RepID=A0A8B8PAC4_9MYRT|nr:SNAP25 homologous protein SNAP33-like isoform X2 [Rhodamnia argentea]
MFGSKKSPLKLAKHSSVDNGHPVTSGSNPFGSDDEVDNKHNLKTSRRTSSEPTLGPPEPSVNSYNDHSQKGTSSSSYSSSLTYATRNRYKNNFQDSGGLENQSVQELEGYAVYKAEETTKSVNGCLKIAEDMREDATKTLVMLHQQGEQITRSHAIAVDIDHNLSRGEKLLGSLGGMFKKTWKPKTNRRVTGPLITRDAVPTKGDHLEQREKLGLTSVTKQQSNKRTPLHEPTDALQKVEVEKSKQDDALSEISNILGDMKDMAVDMGTEIQRQNKALDHFDKDAEELVFRTEQANQRGRHLLKK